MQCPVLLLIVVVALAGCAKICVPLDRTAIFPKERGVELLQLCIKPPAGVNEFWTPNENDLREVESGLETFLASATDRSTKAIAPHGWRYFYRQVTGIVHNGRRALFLSYAWVPEIGDPQEEAMRRKEVEAKNRTYDPRWWKKRAIQVDDGGSGYFRVIYDLERRQFVWYDENFRA